MPKASSESLRKTTAKRTSAPARTIAGTGVYTKARPTLDAENLVEMGSWVIASAGGPAWHTTTHSGESERTLAFCGGVLGVGKVVNDPARILTLFLVTVFAPGGVVVKTSPTGAAANDLEGR